MPSESSQKYRSGIIQAVQTPLGFFALCILSIEAVLLWLSARASGHDFTLLVAGTLLGLLVLLFLFYRAVSEGTLTQASQHSVPFPDLSENDRRFLKALVQRPGMSAEYYQDYLQKPEQSLEERIKRFEGKHFLTTKKRSQQLFLEPTPPLREAFRLAESFQPLR